MLFKDFNWLQALQALQQGLFAVAGLLFFILFVILIKKFEKSFLASKESFQDFSASSIKNDKGISDAVYEIKTGDSKTPQFLDDIETFITEKLDEISASYAEMNGNFQSLKKEAEQNQFLKEELLGTVDVLKKEDAKKLQIVEDLTGLLGENPPNIPDTLKEIMRDFFPFSGETQDQVVKNAETLLAEKLQGISDAYDQINKNINPLTEWTEKNRHLKEEIEATIHSIKDANDKTLRFLEEGEKHFGTTDFSVVREELIPLITISAGEGNHLTIQYVENFRRLLGEKLDRLSDGHSQAKTDAEGHKEAILGTINSVKIQVDGKFASFEEDAEGHKEAILETVNAAKVQADDRFASFKEEAEGHKEAILETIDSLKQDESVQLEKLLRITDSMKQNQMAQSEKGAGADMALKGKSEETGANLGKLMSWYQEYEKKLQYVNEEGYEKSRKQMKEAQTKYNRWKTYLTKLSETCEDELSYEFTEILEQFKAVKDKRLLTFPIDMRDQEKSLTDLKAFSQAIADFSNDKLIENLAGLANVNVRGGSELDYRMDDSDLPPKVRIFQKQAFNTLLLFSKQLDKKTQTEMLNLLDWTLQNEQHVFRSLKEFDSKALLENLFKTDLSDEEKEKEIRPILNEGDQHLRDNFRDSSRAAELADKLEKKYFTFLKKNLFKILNDLQEAQKNYKADVVSHPDHAEQLEGWAEIYNQLAELFVQYFKKHLNIEQIECQRGDEYHPDIHTPYMESEADADLAENKIKSMVHQGFQFNDADTQIVIKPADVIVVKN